MPATTPPRQLPPTVGRSKIVLHPPPAPPRSFFSIVFKTVLPVVCIVGFLLYVDLNVTSYLLWAIGAILIFVVVLETSQPKHSGPQSIWFTPLGVQLSHGKSVKKKIFLPRGSIHDCILIEHVGAFSVSNHLVFRVKKFSESNNSNNHDNPPFELVPVWDNMYLSFRMCLELKDEINRSLESSG